MQQNEDLYFLDAVRKQLMYRICFVMRKSNTQIRSYMIWISLFPRESVMRE